MTLPQDALGTPKAPEPSAEAKALLRQAFGTFTTGVTVVTARNAEGQPIGFTANSFTSVSLDPPLVLVCPAKSSSNIAAFQQAESFAVTILSAEQTDVSRRFATPMADRFAGLEWQSGPGDVPLINGASAWFACSRHQLVDAGDHLVLIGKVEAFQASPAEPLVFLRGKYRNLTPIDDTASTAIRVGALARCGQKILLRRGPDGTWQLPLGPTRGLFGTARRACEEELLGAGLRLSFEAPYSIFDAAERRETRLIFLAELSAPPPQDSGYALFDLDALPLEQMDEQDLRSLLHRYLHEQAQGQLGIYTGHDRETGRISQMTGQSTRWSDVFNLEHMPQ